MVAKLTLSALTDAKPGANFVDPSVEGLRYRVRGSGRIYAELRHKANGKWRAEPLGRVDVEDRIGDILEAEAEARGEYDGQGRPIHIGRSFSVDEVLEEVRARAWELKRALRRGEDPRGQDSLGALIERFLRHSKARPKTEAERERYLRRDWLALHGRPLAQITRREIAAHLLRLREEKAPRGAVAVNRARSALSGCFTWAIKHGLAEHNPVEATEVVAERARERVLTLDELRALWRAADGDGLSAPYCGVLRLLLLTGQRRAEVGSMLWSEVDLDGALWRLPGSRTKNGRPHEVPLSGPAVDLLLATPTRGPYVFGERQGYVNWAPSKRRLDARLALPAWTLHDIRRSVVTGMAELGVLPHVIEALVNHISGRTKVAGVYNLAHHAGPKREALARWAEHFLGESPRG